MLLVLERTVKLVTKLLDAFMAVVDCVLENTNFFIACKKSTPKMTCTGIRALHNALRR